MPELGRYLDAAKFLELLAARVGGDEHQALESALHASEGKIHFTEIETTNLADVRTQLTAALGALARRRRTPVSTMSIMSAMRILI